MDGDNRQDGERKDRRWERADRFLRESREQRLQRFKAIPIRFLLPNIITLLALCSGITAIRLGVDGRFELAVGAVIVAVVLDAIDGRVARLLKGQSRFGAELDSLADFVNFGVTPALLLHIWSLHVLKNLGWIVCLCLAICCALRLARFNVMATDPDRPAWMSSYFTGIPAPAGAGLAMAPMYVGFLGFDLTGKPAAFAIALWVAFVAVGMVSRMPTFSGKTLGQRVQREMVLPIIAAVVIAIVLLIGFTWEMLTVFALAYVAMLPFGVRSYNRQKAAWKARKAEGASPKPSGAPAA
ncbi:MAG: phosphatidylcholine/phosphatidylserine synthase [Hyphomicrobiales bacterium]